MLSAFAFLFLISLPTDPASKLLEEYLSIRNDPSQNGTAEAAKFWTREAKFLDLKVINWTIDSTGKCTNFITYLPATTAEPGRPILLLHHGDVAYSESAKPEWAQEKTDYEIFGPGALNGKAPGVVHWMALKNLANKMDQPRNRDIYFVMTCGSQTRDPKGAKAFVHFFIKSIPDFSYELSTVEKFELAAVFDRFPTLPKVEWVWNEGSFANQTRLEPYTLAPIATSQKGDWLGRVEISGSRQPTALQALTRGLARLDERNRGFIEKFRSLHIEMSELVSLVSKTRPIWERVWLWFYPRSFFRGPDEQTLVTSQWAPVEIQNQGTHSASVQMEYRFLGEKQILEIETELKNIFGAELAHDSQLTVKTEEFIPFRRDFFKGSEADIFKRVLENYPKVIVSPFISSRLTESRYFRLAGVRVFDFVPFFLRGDRIAVVAEKSETLPHAELLRAVEIESAILEKLVQ